MAFGRSNFGRHSITRMHRGPFKSEALCGGVAAFPGASSLSTGTKDALVPAGWGQAIHEILGRAETRGDLGLMSSLDDPEESPLASFEPR